MCEWTYKWIDQGEERAYAHAASLTKNNSWLIHNKTFDSIFVDRNSCRMIWNMLENENVSWASRITKQELDVYIFWHTFLRFFLVFSIPRQRNWTRGESILFFMSITDIILSVHTYIYSFLTAESAFVLRRFARFLFFFSPFVSYGCMNNHHSELHTRMHTRPLRLI